MAERHTGRPSIRGRGRRQRVYRNRSTPIGLRVQVAQFWMESGDMVATIDRHLSASHYLETLSNLNVFYSASVVYQIHRVFRKGCGSGSDHVISI